MSEIKNRVSVAELLSEGARIAADLSLGGDTDEELDQKEASFSAWLAECDDKALACKIVIGALESDALRHKAAEQAIAARRKAIEFNIAALRDRTLALVDARLEGTGQKSIKTDDGGTLTLTVRNSLTVEVTDPMLLGELGEWIFKPDVNAIKAEYKSAGAVAGATITESVSKSLIIK